MGKKEKVEKEVVIPTIPGATFANCTGVIIDTKGQKWDTATGKKTRRLK